MDPGRPIGAPAHPVDINDGVGQIGVVEVLVGDGIGLPGIETRARHPHDPTADRHGQVRAGPGNEGAPHFGLGLDSLAKYTAARLRISISIFAVRSSRRSWTSSARSSVESPFRRHRRCRPASSNCAGTIRRCRGRWRSGRGASLAVWPVRRPAGGTPVDTVVAWGHPSKRRLSAPQGQCPPERGKLT